MLERNTYNEALKQGASIGGKGRRRVKQRRTEEGFSGALVLPDDGRNNAHHADNHGSNCLGTLPLELDAGPRYADKKASHAANEKEAANPVDAFEFGANRCLFGAELDVNRDEHEAQGAEGKLQWRGFC